MIKTYSYSARVEPGDTAGVLVVTFPDVPEAIAQGSGITDALAQAEDALGTALLSYPMRGLPLPQATGSADPVLTVLPDVAAKLALIEAFAGSGMSKSELSRRIGKDEKEVRRLLDPFHPSKIGPMSEALLVFGKRLVVGVDDRASAA